MMDTDETKSPAAGAETMAWNEFRAAAGRSLARLEARWPQELELGLQELDARYEPIVDELKLFFTPQGVVPKLPLPASMAEVFRAHADEVVQHIREREERLIEELRSELEAELQRCVQSTPPRPQAASESAEDDAAQGTSAAGAAAGSVPFQLHAWTLVAVSTPVHLDNILALVDRFADDCFEQLCSSLPPRLSFLVKLIRKVRKWGKTPVWVVRSLSPRRLLLWGLKKLASPARFILLATLPLAVRQAMGRARASLQEQFEAHAAALVRETHDFIETMRPRGAQATDSRQPLSASAQTKVFSFSSFCA